MCVIEFVLYCLFHQDDAKKDSVYAAYKDSLPVLKARVQVLEAVRDGPNYLKTVKESLKSVDRTKLPYAMEKLDTVLSVEELREQAATLGDSASCFEELVVERKKIEDKALLIMVFLCKGVKNMTTVCLEQRQKAELDIVSCTKNRQKAEAKAKSIIASAKVAISNASGKGRGKNKNSGKGIFNVDWASSQPFPIRASAIETVGSWDTPWILREFVEGTTLLGSNPCRLHLLVFKTNFAKEKSRRDSKTMMKAEEVRRQLMAFGPPKDALVMDDNDMLNEVQVYGYAAEMTSICPAVHNVGTMRVAASKSNDVLIIAIPFAPLQAQLQTLKASEQLPSMQEIVSALRNLDAGDYDTLKVGSEFRKHTVLF
jgi:hypothetical protein